MHSIRHWLDLTAAAHLMQYLPNIVSQRSIAWMHAQVKSLLERRYFLKDERCARLAITISTLRLHKFDFTFIHLKAIDVV
jgi:hypothetical protein